MTPLTPFVVGLLSLALPFSALPPPSAADVGADWYADLVGASGFVPNPADAPDVSATLEGAIALGMAGVEEPTFDAMVAWLEANVDTVIAPYGTDNPGQLGYLLILADLAGIPATDFGGVDLIARLAATLGAYEAGLYGADDPTYDGAYRQSIALVGLRAHGIVPPASAVDWLTSQQCDAPAAAVGGWQAYRVDTSVDCDLPDPDLYTGPDTNSTALAVMAEVATGGSADLTGALAFLATAESAAAGWAYVPGGDDDPNSTALVLMALAAAGEDPDGATWLRGGVSPVQALLAWQLGCEAPAGDQGAFASPFSDGNPDPFATRQSIWGASGRTFPPGDAAFEPTPDPCAPVGPTTTSPPSTVAPDGTTATTAVAATVTPAFTG